MGTYEVVAVLRPDLDEEGMGAALDRVSQRITELGGSLVSLDRWGKRRLAYLIQKHRDGYYALFVFSLQPGRIAPLRQVLGLNEDLLRFAFASHRPKPVPAGAGQGAAAGTPHSAPGPAAQGASATASQASPPPPPQGAPAQAPAGTDRPTTPPAGTPHV